MAVRNLSVVLDLDTSRFTGNLTNARGQLSTFSGAVRSTNATLGQMSTSLRNVERAVTSPVAKMRDWLIVIGHVRSAMLTLRDVTVGWLGGIVEQAGKIERLTMLMEGLSNATSELGKKQDAANSLKAVYDMAGKSGFAVEALADSFTKLKSGHVDPLNGSLQGLVDATAAFGGDSEVLKRASIAIQQMAGKGVVSMEELRQQLGEAVPTAMEVMARAAGKTIPEFTKLVAQGAVQAGPALEGMFKEMERTYAGAGQRLASTLFGQIAQFKTNFAQMTAEFTGLGKSDGMFAGIVTSLREINAALRSNEARAFIQSLGQGLGNIGGAALNLIQTLVKFRGEIAIVGKALAAVFVIRTLRDWGAAGLKMFADMRTGAGNLMAQLRGVGTNTSAVLDDTKARLANMNAVQFQSRQLAALAIAERESAQAQVASAQGAYAASNATVTGLNREYAAIEAQIEARVQLRTATGQFMSVAATQVELLNQLEVVENRLTAAHRNRTAAIEALNMAETNLFTKETVETAAVEANTLATSENTIAKRALTVAQGLAAASATAFGEAVNLALGPVGMIATAVYFAAQQMGLFETAADKAKAAADRMAQGFADAADKARVASRIASLTNERGQLAAGATVTTGLGGDDALYLTEGMRSKRIGQIDQEMANLQSSSHKGQKAEADNFVNGIVQTYTDGYERIRVNTATTYRNALTSLRNYHQEYHTSDESYLKAQQQLAASSDRVNAGAQQDLMGRLQARRDAMKKAGKDTAGLDTALTKLHDQWDAAAGSASSFDKALGNGKGGQKFANQIANGAGALAQLQAKLNGSFGALAKFNAELDAGKFKGATQDQIAALRSQAAQTDALHAAMGGGKVEDAFMSKIQSIAGRVAQLSEELAGGTGELAKFEAQMKANPDAYKGIPPELIKRYKEFAATLDDLEGKKNKETQFSSLDKELSKSAALASTTWASFNAGSLEADKRLQDVTARFAGLTDGLKGDDLKRAQEIISQIVANLTQVDMTDTVQQWKDETSEILASLKTEDQAREENFQRELHRRQTLINAMVQGSEQQKTAQAQLNAWMRAQSSANAVANESSLTKQMKDWANLGQGIVDITGNALGTFVDGVAGANLNVGKMAVDIIKNLVKIILEAMIAYAILSAIGMTPTNKDGSTMSAGQFLKGGLTGGFSSLKTGAAPSQAFSAPTGNISGGLGMAHSGGLIGGKLMNAGPIDTAVFAAARKYHSGGWIGGRKLTSKEQPIIAEKGELMLTEDQQDILSGRMKAMPDVHVNVINNSGTQVDAEQSQPRIQGKKMILDVVLDAAQSSASFRRGLQGAVGR